MEEAEKVKILHTVKVIKLKANFAYVIKFLGLYGGEE